MTDAPTLEAPASVPTVATPDDARFRVGWDTETHLIGLQNLTPKIVCLTLAMRDEGKPIWPRENYDTDIQVEDDKIHSTFVSVAALNNIFVGQNTAYDLAVMAANFPDLIPLIFNLLENGQVRDTKIREKLIHLTLTGDIEFVEMPDGTKIKTKFSLADLVKWHMGIDITASKTQEDAWRLNYSVLDDVPIGQWPEDAKSYAIDDSVYALAVHDFQELQRQRIVAERGVDPFATQNFQVAVDFALYLMSCRGFAVDPAEKAKIQKMLEEKLAPENMSLLFETEILRPAKPARPYANGAKHPDGTPKMTEAEPESMNTKVLKAFVENLAKAFPEDVKIKKTAPSKKFPEGQISTDAEWLEDHKHLSPVLEQLADRNSLQKLITTELPRMCLKDAKGNSTGQDSPVVHPCFDVLKRTGRTSSFASDLYPSFNVQNVHEDVRRCFVPRPGFLFWSIDYSYMELCTFAQKCLQLFGFSRLAEIINSGKDPHAWLGSQLMLRLDPEFITHLLQPSGIDPADGDKVYEAFMSMKKCGEPNWEAAFKKWRTFAKPTGLGYPGGLGPKTFVAYAKATYHVSVTVEVATQLRDAWREALPEAPMYFDWINNQCIDPWNKVRTKTIHNPDGTTTERQVEVYSYLSPMGMYRAGCDYCAAANGAALQTPSAEGAKLAVFNVSRACFDPSMQSPIYGGKVWPQGFIHDEMVGEVVDKPEAPEYLGVVAEIMVDAFRQVTPDINIKAQPVLMRKWDKAAEPVFDAQGRLIPWEPKAK